MARMSEERLVKVYINLPEEGLAGGESFWAKPLGDNLFEIRNIPFAAYDLHFNDVVRAVAPDAESNPQVQEVVRRSGHKTLRVLFAEHVTDEEKRRVLGKLDGMKASYERGTSQLYAIDVEPEGSYSSVCDYLGSCEQAGWLRYETGVTMESA